MKPIFTIHAGEYLVASEIEEKYSGLRVWIPSKDTGIDILVTSEDCKKSVSLQVKFSKDFFGRNVKDYISKGVKSCGWWTIDRKKLETSPADYWVLVLYQFQRRVYDFMILKPSKILSLYDALDRGKGTIQSYIWVTKNNPTKCWETRGLKITDEQKIAEGKYRNRQRNLTSYLNNWKGLKRLLRNT